MIPHPLFFCIFTTAMCFSYEYVFLFTEISWQVWVFTSDTKHAGTDANVFVVLYGDKGKSDDIKLNKDGDSFEQGQMDIFNIDTPDVGLPYKLRVYHDNSGRFAAWHLDKVTNVSFLHL